MEFLASIAGWCHTKVEVCSCSTFQVRCFKMKLWYGPFSHILLVVAPSSPTVQTFLKAVQKTSFSRMPGELPRRLTEQEALQIQKLSNSLSIHWRIWPHSQAFHTSSFWWLGCSILQAKPSKTAVYCSIPQAKPSKTGGVEDRGQCYCWWLSNSI